MPRPVFGRATVTRVVQETADTRTFVLEPQGSRFAYLAGQYCTFRVPVDGVDRFRSYSMSSAPDVDDELMTTVKRVPGGLVSTWLHSQVVPGLSLELTPPTGRFVLRADASVPLLGFCGGSGITPVLSLAKSALASTGRPVRLLCADRDRESAIFLSALSDLAARYPGRLSVVRRYDVSDGLADAEVVRSFVGADVEADCYVCGPQGFMDVVESALPGPGLVFSERFDGSPASGATSETDGKVTIVLGRKRASVPRRDGETLLESARRAGLSPPTSCEAGNCGTCIAQLTEGSATMRVNDVLTDEEVAEGYVLTCQGVPSSPSATVVYE
ncbi:MAG: ferredoxin--NADP reductase [Streptosporangiaceae bacterium]|jgi:ferredoxin-NADP reductase